MSELPFAIIKRQNFRETVYRYCTKNTEESYFLLLPLREILMGILRFQIKNHFSVYPRRQKSFLPETSGKIPDAAKADILKSLFGKIFLRIALYIGVA